MEFSKSGFWIEKIKKRPNIQGRYTIQPKWLEMTNYMNPHALWLIQPWSEEELEREWDLVI